MASNAHVRTVISSSQDDDFRATMRVVDLGEVQVSSLTYPALRAHRTGRLIRQSDPELLHVSLIVRGGVLVSQASRNMVVRANEFVLYDTSQPCLVVNDEPVAQTVVQFHRKLLPVPSAAVGRWLATPVPARRGVGGLVRRFLVDLIQHADEYHPTDATRLSTAILDLLGTLYAHRADEERPVPTDARRRVLLACILDFIQRRLSDPGLDPATIAAAHQVSVRYLHLLFEEQEVTVTGWIRQRRLDQCRRDLADPGLSSRTVGAIGVRWGFADASAFSRVFHRAYGLPPGEFRRLMSRREPDAADDAQRPHRR